MPTPPRPSTTRAAALAEAVVLAAAAVLAAGAVWAVATPSRADEAPLAKTPVLSAELVSETTSVQPGTPVQLAIRLVLQSGWHVYWKNAGDSGMAPRVTWD